VPPVCAPRLRGTRQSATAAIDHTRILKEFVSDRRDLPSWPGGS
jgi:hypothetical protein